MSILSTNLIKRTATFASAFVLAVSTLTATLPFVFSSAASALSFTTVYPNDANWNTSETRSNGTVAWVADADTAFGDGALQLKTGAATGSPLQDKANIIKYFASPIDLDTVTGPINYSTKQISASFAAGLPSYQIPVLLDGTAPSFTTLVYEPYVDQGNAAVANNVWQNWNVGTGKLWSSKNLPAYNIVGSQGSTTYTLADIKANFPNAVVLGFGVNVGSNNPNWDTRVDAVTFNGDTYDFEPFAVPACSADNTNFDTFANGSVNGQNGWSSTGPFDQAIVDNNYGISSFGCKSLRISNSTTSGSFGDQTFSYSTANEAGEADSTNGGQSGGTRVNHYEAQFDIASTQSTVQTGLSVSVSPDRGDGSRMSYLRFVDGLNGIEIYFDDVQSTGFEETYLGILSNRAVAHTIKFVIDFKDGASNDVVNIYIDGVLKHTGTSWEDYYRFDPESAAEQTPRTSDSLLFRVAGTAAPATVGKGFLFDNVLITTSNTSVEVPAQPGSESGNNGGSTGGTTSNPVTTAITPAITSPASVLGADSNNTNDNGSTDVEGASDSKSVDGTQKDAVNGLLFGIAWYWWLLILAILGGAGWWIVGALRRRNNDQ